MLKKRVKRWFLIGIVFLVIIGALLWRPYLSDFFHTVRHISLGQIPIGDRILIIAPHPDDETIGGAGIIEKALRAGKQIKVVIVTTGDGFKLAVAENYHVIPTAADYKRMGEDRHLESVEAMKHFGVKKEDVLFLGYPDGGLSGMWESNWEYNHLHFGANGSTHSPYGFVYEKQAPYCGANLVKNFKDIIRKFQPTDIVYPDPNDNHPDHWATNAFVKYVLTEHHIQAKEWTYLVHRGDFPAPWLYEPNKPLYPPKALTGLDTDWIYIPMSDQEKQKKRESLRKYKTQIKVMDPYLEAFVRTNELLGTYVNPVLSNKEIIFIRDPKEDTVRRELNPYADIVAVKGMLLDNQLSIGIVTREAIKNDVTYHLRIRYFTPNGVKRIDASVRNHHLSTSKYANNSLDLPKEASVQTDGNKLWIRIPMSVFSDTTDLMVSADTLLGQTRIDKTAWRLVHLDNWGSARGQ